MRRQAGVHWIAPNPALDMGYSFAIVEDDELLQHLTERVLSKAFKGCRITVFADGVEALAHGEHVQWDLMIVDDRMPRMGGIGLVKELRARGTDIPIIMYSNAPESEASGRAAGINDFLYKAELDRLPDLVRKWIMRS